LLQFATDIGNGEHKGGIQSAGVNGFRMFKGACRLELQFRVRLSLAKLPKRIWNRTMPGDAFHESDTQRSRLAGGDALGTRRRFITW
jgi:hypothetical protein